MSFRLALPRKALTSFSPPFSPGVLERFGDPLKHHQRKPLLTNHSKSVRTLTLQNQSKQRIITVLGRIERFFSGFGTERASSEAEENGFMKNLKNYLIKNSEQMLALVILVGVPTIAHLVPYKLVFLNFFFVVILLSVYFVEAHKALMGGVLTTLLVAIFVYYFPSSFVPTFTELDFWMNILAWSSFLILTGGAVGKT